MQFEEQMNTINDSQVGRSLLLSGPAKMSREGGSGNGRSIGIDMVSDTSSHMGFSENIGPSSRRNTSTRIVPINDDFLALENSVLSSESEFQLYE